MSRFVLPFLLAIVAVPPASAAPVPAGLIPKQLAELPVAADSMVVIHLNGIDRTRDRLAKMLAGIDADFGKNTVKFLDEKLNDALDGRDLKAIDGTGRIFVALGDLGQLTGPDAPMAICLPVTDYKAFREKFLTAAERKSFSAGKNGVDEFEAAGSDRTTYLVNKDGYLVLTRNKPMAEQYAGKFDKLTVKAMGRTADALLGADVSAFVNLEQINATYGDQIKQGRDLLKLLLQQGGAGLDKKQLEMIKEVFQTVFQMVEDGRGLVIGFEFRPEGALLRFDARFAMESDTGKLVGAQKLTALAALGDLPKGMMSYSATKWKVDMGKMFQEIAAAPDEEKSAEAIEALAKLLTDGGNDNASASADFHNTITLRVVADADKTSAATLTVLKGLTAGASFSSVLIKGRPDVTEAAEKYKGFTFHKADVKLDFEATVEKLANDAQRDAAIASMKRLVPEKVTQWFGSDGKRFVTVTAPDWAKAKVLLDGALDKKAKASDDPAFAATRKQLPGEAGSIMLFDVVRGLAFVGDYLEGLGGALPGLPINLPKVGKVKGDPVYLGFALGLEGDTARADIFVPVAAVKLIRQAFADE